MMTLQSLGSRICQNANALIITTRNKTHYLSTNINNQLTMKKMGEGIAHDGLFKFRVVNSDVQDVYQIVNYKNEIVGINKRNGSLMLQVNYVALQSSGFKTYVNALTVLQQNNETVETTFLYRSFLSNNQRTQSGCDKDKSLLSCPGILCATRKGSDFLLSSDPDFLPTQLPSRSCETYTSFTSNMFETITVGKTDGWGKTFLLRDLVHKKAFSFLVLFALRNPCLLHPDLQKGWPEEFCGVN
jgi:hypothetical protein